MCALGATDVTGGFRRKDLNSKSDAKKGMPVLGDITYLLERGGDILRRDCTEVLDHPV